MARLPRLSVAGAVHLVVWRGNNGQAVFQDATDRRLFLDLLAECARTHGLAVHAYCLLDSEVMLLLTPSTQDALSRGMQALGRSYVRRHNLRHGRSGTLWEGRYGSTVLQAETYLWRCMVCLDLAPVRAGLVQTADGYGWSSHSHYTGRRQDRWLSMPALYWTLGNTPFAREAAYARLIQEGGGGIPCHDVFEAARHGWALGDADFLHELQEQTGRRTTKGRAGRRPKAPSIDRPIDLSPIKFR